MLKLFLMICNCLRFMCIYVPFLFVGHVVQLYTYFVRRVVFRYPPGPLPNFWQGNTHAFGKKPLKYMLDVKNKYGDVASIHLGHCQTVVVSNYELIKELLEKSEAVGKHDCAGFTSGRIYNGTTSEQIAIHTQFLSSVLNDLVASEEAVQNAVDIEGQALVHDLVKKIDSPILSTGLFNKAVTNSLWAVIGGQRFEPDNLELQVLLDLLSAHVRTLKRTSSVYYFPWITKYLRRRSNADADADDIKTEIEDILKFMRRNVENYASELEWNPNQMTTAPPSLIKSYFERFESEANNPNSMFHGEIGKTNLAAAMGDLLIEGPEIVSVALNWAILFLILHPDVQETMYDEVYHVFKDYIPTLEYRDSMPYTRAVISEVLRCSCVIPFTPCHRATPNCSLAGYRIPKNSLIIANLHAAHRDEKCWGPDVLDFNPDRFLMTNAPNAIPPSKVYRSRASFLPFSVGKRMCIGRQLAEDQLFLFLVSLVHAFKFSPDFSQTTKELVDSRDCDQTSFILSPNPYQFRIELRSGDSSKGQTT